MQANAQIRIYSVGIYLFKPAILILGLSVKSVQTWQNHLKKHRKHENKEKHWWRSDVFIINFVEHIPHLFLVLFYP